jgi:hypothetical protein
VHTFNKAKLKALGEDGCLQPGPTYGAQHRIVVLSAGDSPDAPDPPDKGADKPSKELRDLAKQLSEDSERSTEVAERLNALADALDSEVEPAQDK